MRKKGTKRKHTYTQDNTWGQIFFSLEGPIFAAPTKPNQAAFLLSKSLC